MNKAKHAFGSSSRISEALANGTINERDILFLDENTDNPKIGWITKGGEVVILKDEKADLSELESDVSALETEVATKANAEDVNAKIGEIESALDEVAKVAYAHEKVKYEITDAPEGTLVDIRDDEIRIMCPHDSEYHLQSVGYNGDANTYYVTLKTYAPNNNCVGYREHLAGQIDKEVLTDLKVDSYGRKYQPTWLGVAKYDAVTGTWSYYGAKSTSKHYIGWDYQIDWFGADGVMIASDSVRVNLSNEDCHYVNEPYYINKVMSEVDEKIAKITEEVAGAIEVVEF